MSTRTHLRLVVMAGLLWFGVLPNAPGAESAAADSSLVSQTVLLEGTRQDMITYQLRRVASQFEVLARDLRSNQIADEQLEEDLNGLAARIHSLQNDWIEKVRTSLDEVPGQAGPRPEAVRAVQQDVRNVVRKLAILLLEGGVRYATEVAVTRIEDIADKQRRLLEADPDAGTVAAQRGIVAEVRELLDHLAALEKRFESPLAAVRLSRVRKSVERAKAAQMLAAAADALENNQTEVARERQRKALGILAEAREKLRAESESSRRDDLRRRITVSSGRIEQLQVYQDRQLEFATRLESASEGESDRETLLQLEERQLNDVEGIMKSLPDERKWTPAIRASLKQAAEGIRASIAALKNDQPDTAIGKSGDVIGALRETVDRLDQRVRLLRDIDSHLQLAENLHVVSGFLDDAEHEQADLRAAGVRNAQTAADQKVLAAAMEKLNQTLAGASDAVAVSDAIQKARAEMTDLLQAEDIEPQDLTERRGRAETNVRNARRQAVALAARAQYIAEWLEYLGDRQAGLLSLLARQIALRERTQREDEELFGELTGVQEALHEETGVYAAEMEIGTSHFKVAVDEMGKAVAKLKAVDRETAVFHQRRAEDALRAAAKALADLMGQVAEITALGRMNAYDAEVHIITKLMMLAVEQRRLRRRTGVATPEQLRKFTKREQEHLRKATLVVLDDEQLNYFPQVERLDEVADEMGRAVAALDKPDRDEAIRHQQLAEKGLRLDIASLVSDLLEVTDIVVEEGEGAGGEGLSVNVAMPMESVMAFSGLVSEPYEEKRGGRSTWEPLSPRQRAALSENFARELPLEYRATLKAYYRALAE